MSKQTMKRESKALWDERGWEVLAWVEHEYDGLWVVFPARVRCLRCKRTYSTKRHRLILKHELLHYDGFLDDSGKLL